MAKPRHTPDVTIVPSPRQVRIEMRRLNLGVISSTEKTSERRMDRFLSRASRSWAATETAFAAVQTLRDFGGIDGSEAAWLFGELFELHIEDFEAGDGPIGRAHRAQVEVLSRTVETPLDASIVQANYDATNEAYRQGRLEVLAEFHRARGEDRLADMILTDGETYSLMCADGGHSLIEEKGFHDRPVMRSAEPKAVARIAESILSYSSLESLREVIQNWRAAQQSVSEKETGSAIAAVQQVRAVGAISEAEGAYLIDDFLSMTFQEAWEVDRACARLRKAMEAVEREHGAAPDTGFPKGQEPLEWKVLDAQLKRRMEAIAAFWLRRYGEHRLANLIIERPVEYDRMVNDGTIVGGGFLE
jgi:hypothetical protein